MQCMSRWDVRTLLPKRAPPAAVHMVVITYAQCADTSSPRLKMTRSPQNAETRGTMNWKLNSLPKTRSFFPIYLIWLSLIYVYNYFFTKIVNYHIWRARDRAHEGANFFFRVFRGWVIWRARNRAQEGANFFQSFSRLSHLKGPGSSPGGCKFLSKKTVRVVWLMFCFLFCFQII